MSSATPPTPSRTELHEIGEEGLIERIKTHFTGAHPPPTLRQGIGDDAAVYQGNKGMCQVVSTDMLVEGTHFDLSYMPLTHLGYKAVAVNVSDIVAMNAEARYLMSAVGLSNRFSVEATDQLFKGIHEACHAYNLSLIGGDTVSTPAGLVLSCVAIGEAQKTDLVYRAGAQIKDVICVSGDLGSAYLGLEVLRRKKQEFKTSPDTQPDLAPYRYLIGRQIKPEARRDLMALFGKKGVRPNAMMDLSDGLACALSQLCSASKVGAHIEAEALPLHALSRKTADELNLNPLKCALFGGEDYELLWTMKPEQYQTLKNHADIHRIGHIQTPDKGLVLSQNGITKALDTKGWKHF